MRFVYRKEFIKKFDSYPAGLQKVILETDHQIKSYLQQQTAAYGLRIKKIGPRTFEARVTDKVRMVWVQSEDTACFSLLGSHDEVSRFIKRI